MPEKEKEAVIAVGWYRWLHAGVRNAYDRKYRKRLHEFQEDHELVRQDGDLQLTVKLLTSIPPTETEMYFLMNCIDVADERENYRDKAEKHYQGNYQIICFDNGKIMIPTLCFHFSKLEQVDGSYSHSMSIPDLSDKNSFLNTVFYVLDRFFPQI